MSHARFSTPGRVCLFGEHQDYLHLPVVPSAISLRIAIDARHTDERTVHIDLPDLQSGDRFSLDGPLEYRNDRDYLRSGVNVIRRHGFTFGKGLRAWMEGKIPINAGTSSSSAMLVTWMAVLGRLSDQEQLLSPEECARLAHEAEVIEFGEPGGQMDHYSTALGGILAIDFAPALRLEKLSVQLGTFVLGNSREPKDTKGILARVKNQVVHAFPCSGAAPSRLLAAHRHGRYDRGPCSRTERGTDGPSAGHDQEPAVDARCAGRCLMSASTGPPSDRRSC